jgi:ankyrin repeat protein
VGAKQPKGGGVEDRIIGFTIVVVVLLALLFLTPFRLFVLLEMNWAIKLRLLFGSDPNGLDEEGEPLLIAAARSFSASVVKALLSGGASVNATASDGGTALHAAAYGLSTDTALTLRALLDAGADVNARTASGLTPLHAAMSNTGEPELVRLLVERGAKVGAKDADGMTPLALAFDDPGMIEVLVQAGADLDARDDHGATPLMSPWLGEGGFMALLGAGADPHAVDLHGRSVLMYVAEHGAPSVVSALLGAGVAHDVRTPFGWSALEFARRQGAVDRRAEVEALLDAASAPATPWTPDWSESSLHAAARSGDRRVLEEGSPAASEINARIQGGRSPLMIAAASPAADAALVGLFLEHGASVEAVDEEGRGALHYAAEFGCSGRVQVLLGAGAKVRRAGKRGWQPLALAVSYGERASVEALLEAGASPDTETEQAHERQRVLWLAVRNADAGPLAALLSAGACVTAKDSMGESALHMAARSAKAEHVGALISAGAPIEAVGEELKWTPLMWAASRSDDPGPLRALLRGGAQLETRAAGDCTALMLAASLGGPEQVKALLEAGAKPKVRGDAHTWTALAAAQERGQDDPFKEAVIRVLS